METNNDVANICVATLVSSAEKDTHYLNLIEKDH